MNLFKRLFLVFTHGRELEEFVMEARKNHLLQQMESKKHNLKLCHDHRQEENHSIYAKENCDHCKVLNELVAALHSEKPSPRDNMQV